MPIYYLRIEAVNLDNSVYDTHDISTIRGGSFILLEVMNNLKGRFGLEDAGTAASIGIFKFDATNDNAAESVRQQVLNSVNNNTREFATYVSAWERADTSVSFDKIIQLLTAKCRWQQYHKPTLVFPEFRNDNEDFECYLDRVRPALQSMSVGNEQQILSKSVFDRRKEGRKLRDKIYRDLLNIKNIEFTDDLETLATRSEGGSLDGKIAFIHIDGNRFGRIREDLCKNEDGLKRFQRLIQEMRESTLREILDKACASKSFQTKDGKIRLETLLWGGDEIEWVVPAWQALNVLNTFFQQTKDKQFDKIPLTHAVGVLFCHHNLPILQVRRYAEQLCRVAKDTLPEGTFALDASANCFAFLNMVSFDQMTRNINGFLEKYHAPAHAEDFVISCGDLESLTKHLKAVKRLLPKNKLHDILNTLQISYYEQQMTKAKDEVKEIIERTEKSMGKQSAIDMDEAIKAIIDDKPERWYLISDLWDYIGEADYV